MSYVDKLTETEKAKYSIVSYWQFFVSNGTLVASNVIFDSDVVIEFQLKSITFIDCYFLKDFRVQDLEGLSSLFFRDCFFDESLRLERVKITDGRKSIQLNNVRVNHSASINECMASECYIYATECKEISLRFCELSLFSLSKEISLDDVGILHSRVDIGKVHIENCTGNFSINHVNAKTMFLLHFDRESKLLLSNVVADSLLLWDWRDDSYLRFSELEAGSKNSSFILINCNLKNAEFYKVNLESYQNITISETNLINTSFSNVKWNYIISSASKNPLDQRETYRQIKFALSKQGDSINEQHFHVMEMKSYLKSLDLKYARNWGVYLIIKLSDITSDFGQSISKPFFWLLFGHSLLFFVAMLTGLSSVHISFTNASWSALNTAVYEYLYLINPLHKTEDLPKDWTIIIDVFMRIWSSYMIYNIIRASRRFIK